MNGINNTDNTDSLYTSRCLNVTRFASFGRSWSPHVLHNPLALLFDVSHPLWECC